MASVTELDDALSRYEEALLLKGKEALRDLDTWYRGELRDAVRARQSVSEQAGEGGAYLTHAEMVKLIKWKLSRGKFRPALEGYVCGNAETLVHSSTQAALCLLLPLVKEERCNPKDDEIVRKAMKEVCQMKGVGPGLSSAILALALPNTLPYMSDEVIKYGAGIESVPKYSEKEYIALIKSVQKQMDSLKAKSNENRKAMQNRSSSCLLNVEQFEKACWAFGILQNNINDKQLNGSANLRRSQRIADKGMK